MYTQAGMHSQTNSNTQVHTCKGEKAEAKAAIPLGAQGCNRTSGLALVHDAKRTGEVAANPTAPSFSLHAKTTRSERQCEAT